MKFLIAALLLMGVLYSCTDDDSGVVTTGDVVVEDTQADAVEETADVSVDSNDDVATVEEDN
jgi:hypothetical protein